MLAPSFTLIKYPVFLAYTKTQDEKRLAVADVQNTGFTGDAISLGALKLLDVLPGRSGTHKDRLNLLVNDDGILRTL